MRSVLRRAVTLPQGNSPNFGLANAATAVAAIGSLIRSFKVDERPPDVSRTVLEEGLRLSLDAADITADKLSRLPNDETERLRARAARIEKARRDIGLLDHLTRVDEAVSTADQGLPVTRRPTLVGPWKADLAKLRAWPDLDRRIEAVEDALDPLVGDAPKPPTRLGLLTFAAAQPAADIEAVDRLLTSGEQALAQVLDLVSDFVREGPPGSLSVSEVRQRGRDIADAAGDALKAWRAT